MKTILILGGVAVVGYLVWKQMRSAKASTPAGPSSSAASANPVVKARFPGSNVTYDFVKATAADAWDSRIVGRVKAAAGTWLPVDQYGHEVKE